MSKALVVFTYKSRDRLLEMGGTASWSLNPASLRDCDYVVCTRNTDPAKRERGADEARGTAFLVGRIAGLEKMAFTNGRQRYKVVFSDVAEVHVPGIWDGSRSPTRYVDTAELAAKGLDVAALVYRPLPSTPAIPDAPAIDPRGLTIAQAKSGLAAMFGVDESNIEIIIKG